MSSWARVVPALPTFAVDAGFRYKIAGSSSVEIGSIVRVPLSGRAVRGYVVGLGDGDTEGLKEIRGVSGEAPVFDRDLLTSVDWAANHYVAPRSVVLARCAPPNVPRLLPPHPHATSGQTQRSAHAPLDDFLAQIRAGKRARTSYVLAADRPGHAALDAATALQEERLSTLVVVPTVHEAEQLHAAAVATLGGDNVYLATGTSTGRALTDVWASTASGKGWVLIGTPRVQLWRFDCLDLGVIVEDGRRAHKERATPTLHTRDVLQRRSTIERFSLLGVGQVPSSELYAGGLDVYFRPGRRRAWPAVEVVEHREPNLIGRRSRAALESVLTEGRSAIVFTARHQGVVRCARCRTVRECVACGAGGTRSNDCPRCGNELGPCSNCGSRRFAPASAGKRVLLEELAALLPRGTVGGAGSGTPIQVVTERDLPSAGAADLAVAVDVDGLLFGTNYRAQEEALRVLARVATLVPERGGRRTIVQARDTTHPVLVALHRGDPQPFLAREVADRAQFQLPPASQLLVLETRGDVGDFPSRLAEASSEILVMGPADLLDRQRWLLQGDLGKLKLWLRPQVQRLRDQGVRVRLDADPLDL